MEVIVAKKVKRDRYKAKRKAMIKALTDAGYNVTKACKAVKIDRQTHYNWLDNFGDYKKECEAIEEGLLDNCENRLQKNIDKGNIVAQIFYLKTKGKHRGYFEKTEVDNKHKIDKGGVNITVIGVSPTKEDQEPVPDEKPVKKKGKK